MADFTTKQGDNALVFNDTLTNTDDSTSPPTVTAVDLTGASVQFVMRALTATTPAINASATIGSPSTAGKVSYTPTATDTATAGMFNAYWIVTFGGGAVQRFPTNGYLTVEIQENLETANQTIVELDDVKDYLNLPATARSHDGELMRFIMACDGVIEGLAGDVLPHNRSEWYDGGQYWIHLRHRPLLELLAVSEWRGPIEFPLAIIQDPGHGSIYSVMVDQAGNSTGPSRIVRRTAGGGVIGFPNMPQSVHVTYVSGRKTIPDTIRQATLELIRVNYQQTQQGGGAWGGSTADDDAPSGPSLGFFIPNRVRELLQRNRRHPRIA